MKEYRKITYQIGSIYLFQILEMIIMLALFVTLTRRLSEYDFGIYSLLNVTILLMIGLLPMGISHFILKDLAGNNIKNQNKKFSQIFSFYLVYVLIASGILIVLTKVILSALGYGALFWPTVQIIGISDLIVIGSLISYFIYAKKSVVKSNIIDFSLKTLWALPVIITLYVIDLNIPHLFAIRLTVTALMFVSLIWVITKYNIKLFSKVDFSYIKKALFFSFPLTMLLISSWVISAIDRYFIGAFHSADAVAHYTFIYTLLNFIMIFSAAPVAATLYPHMVENFNIGKTKKYNTLVNAAIKYIMALVIPMLIGIYILGIDIARLVSGEKYVNAITILPFLIIFPFIEGITSIFRKILVIHGKTKKISVIYGVAMGINVILNLILVPKYSYYGAALATSLTYCFIFIIMILITRRLFQINFKFIKLPQIILSSLIMALVTLLINTKTQMGVIGIIICSAVVYFSMIYLSKAYVKEEKILFKSFIPHPFNLSKTQNKK